MILSDDISRHSSVHVLLLLLFCFLSGMSQSEAAEFFGPDRFWRPRENMAFYLVDGQGGGFDLNIDFRDMNLYCEGPRPAQIFVIGPDGSVLFRQMLPDDGIVRNNPVFKDGCADIGMDFRYRAYHRQNSPGGMPPGKRRSYLLEEPEKIPQRSFKVRVPDRGKGVYRLGIAGCWDHWFSVTPSRTMGGAVHPGQGGLYLHGRQTAEGYLFLHSRAKDVSLALTEEIQPFNWRLTAEVNGRRLTEILPVHFYNYQVLKNLPSGQVLCLKTAGCTAGAMLHVKGIPFLFCDTPQTALTLRGGAPEPEIAALKKNYAQAAWFRKVSSFGPAFGFRDYDQIGRNFAENRNPSLFRSSWWNFGDGRNVVPKEEVSPEARKLLTGIYEKWALNRAVMELGTCTNQWAKILESMSRMYAFTRSPLIYEILRYNVRRICTRNSIGRVNPDQDGFLSGYEADSGCIDNGIMAECLGHDSEYNLETDSDLAAVYRLTKQPEIIDYQNDYYRLKTHLTLSRSGVAPRDTFNGTCSPTDANFRTRFYTHKRSGVLEKLVYGACWLKPAGNHPEGSAWPFLSRVPFSRNLENRYRAVHTGSYYALFYTGPVYPRWQAWNVKHFDGRSMELIGYNGMGYGGWQLSPNKAGGLCAMWVPGCGPVLLGNNHNMMYAWNLWGEGSGAMGPVSGENISPDITSDAWCDAPAEFDHQNNRFLKSGMLPGTELLFRREITAGKNSVKVLLTLTARKDVLMKRLYESIPLYVDGREIRTDGKLLQLPPVQVTPTARTRPDLSGFSADDPVFQVRKLTVTAQNGKGVELVFDREYRCRLAASLRYRKIAATMSGLSLELPLSLKKGRQYSVSCIISVLP